MKMLKFFQLCILTQIVNCMPPSGWVWEDQDPFFSTTTLSPSSTLSPNFRKCLRICPSTSEFNPICGTDNVTYDNFGKLLCAKKCGIVTDKKHDGNCNTKTPTNQSICLRNCVVSPKYQPVCADDGNTYMNKSELACNISCGKKIKKAKDGIC